METLESTISLLPTTVFDVEVSRQLCGDGSEDQHPDDVVGEGDLLSISPPSVVLLLAVSQLCPPCLFSLPKHFCNWERRTT